MTVHKDNNKKLNIGTLDVKGFSRLYPVGSVTYSRKMNRKRLFVIILKMQIMKEMKIMKNTCHSGSSPQ
jgi:hypothetical protein